MSNIIDFNEARRRLQVKRGEKVIALYQSANTYEEQIASLDELLKTISYDDDVLLFPSKGPRGYEY